MLILSASSVLWHLSTVKKKLSCSLFSCPELQMLVSADAGVRWLVGWLVVLELCRLPGYFIIPKWCCVLNICMKITHEPKAAGKVPFGS